MRKSVRDLLFRVQKLEEALDSKDSELAVLRQELRISLRRPRVELDVLIPREPASSVLNPKAVEFVPGGNQCTTTPNFTAKLSVPTHIDLRQNGGGLLEKDSSVSESPDHGGIETFEGKWQPLPADVRGASGSIETHAEEASTDILRNALHGESGYIVPIPPATGTCLAGSLKPGQGKQTNASSSEDSAHKQAWFMLPSTASWYRTSPKFQHPGSQEDLIQLALDRNWVGIATLLRAKPDIRRHLEAIRPHLEAQWGAMQAKIREDELKAGVKDGATERADLGL